MKNLGTIKKMDDLRAVWQHEAHDFSKWLAFKYRTVKELAQTASEFFGISFARKLLARINPENVDIDEMVSRIDEMISSDISSDSNA